MYEKKLLQLLVSLPCEPSVEDEYAIDSEDNDGSEGTAINSLTAGSFALILILSSKSPWCGF